MPVHPSADPVTTFDLVLPALSVAGDRQFASAIARAASPALGLSARILAERLLDLDRRHPPAIGRGVSIARLTVAGLKEPFYLFARLRNRLDRGAPDGRPVDLACVLFTPERDANSYLRVIARLSRLLLDPDVAERLRASSDETQLRAVLERGAALQRAA